MEACGTADHWAPVAQGHGHRVTLLPVRYVKLYLRRNKTNRTDVDALLDAARTGHIPPVMVKTVAQQEIVAWHRIREQWMATRIARINALRGFFREHGIPLPPGARPAPAAVPALTERLPSQVAVAVTSAYEDARALEGRIVAIEGQLGTLAKADTTVQRLLEIPGHQRACPRGNATLPHMTIKARVHAGRLVVDEPTTLPERTEVELLQLDPGDCWTTPTELPCMPHLASSKPTWLPAGSSTRLRC